MATTRETIESRAAAYAPLLRALGVDDEKARDEDTHAILAVLGAEYRQQLATWEAGPRLKDAVMTLRRIETLSGELARALDTCPSAVMNLLRSPFFLSDVDDKMPSDDLLAMFRNAHYDGLPEGPGQGGDWVTRLAALSRFCGRAVARMQEEVGASSGAHGDGARFGAFLDAVAGLALAREVALADAYGHEFLRATLRIRAINRRLDALDAADVTEIGRLLTERGRLKRRLQEGPRKKARPQAHKQD